MTVTSTQNSTGSSGRRWKKRNQDMYNLSSRDCKNKCYICGRYTATETHHMLHGIRRKAADKYGLTCQLCHNCHMNLHDKGFHDLELEQEAQRRFEKKYGHEKFMEVFGKNYL